MAKLTQPFRGVLRGSRRGLKRAGKLISPAEERPPRAIPDVWKWTGPKYRFRSIGLLLLDAALFAGLCCFSYWLRTGQYNPFASEQYWQIWWQTLDWTHERQITLIDFLTYPIPVNQVPMMMIIAGLVLAALTAIPIMVAMLYGFPFSLLFAGIIGFVAMLPWLAVNAIICCYLARWRRLQYSFHYATALVALLPVVFYYALATRNAAASAHRPPVELFMLYVPWVLALVAACLVMAFVLIIARMVNYRPGAIAPLLAVLFAIPVVLFEAKVGRDELLYRLLEHQFGPASKVHFADNVDATAAIRGIAEARLRQIDDPQAALESVMDQVRLSLQFELASMRVKEECAQVARENGAAFAAEQDEAKQACRSFRGRFPHSRYVPNSLYIEGRAIDLRIDQEFFRANLMLRHYQDFPNEASRPAWRELWERFSESPLAAVAGLRLAMLEVRAADGRVDRAVALLDEVVRRWGAGGKKTPGVAAEGGLRGFLAKRPASNTLDVDPLLITQRALKLRDLLVNNRDPEQNDRALRELFRLDPYHPQYRRNLERLLAAINRGEIISRLGDNIELQIAVEEPSHSLRIDALQRCVEKFTRLKNSDALPRALYELGAAYQNDNRVEEAREAYRKVIDQHIKSPWAKEAERRLAAMGMVRIPG